MKNKVPEFIGMVALASAAGCSPSRPMKSSYDESVPLACQIKGNQEYNDEHPFHQLVAGEDTLSGPSVACLNTSRFKSFEDFKQTCHGAVIRVLVGASFPLDPIDRGQVWNWECKP